MKGSRVPNLQSLILILFLLVACQKNDATWQRIEQNGILRVGLDPTYPPFEMADGVPLQGLDVDLARAIGQDLGLEVEFVHFGYDGLYDALTAQQADVLISALVIMPEQLRDFAYSEPYYNAGEILIVPDESDIVGMEGLNGRSLAVELGSLGHVEATQWAKRLPDLTILPFESPDAALTAVADGKADAALVDSISGRIFLMNEPRLRRLPDPVTVEPYAFVVRAKDKRLLEKLNESLARLQTSGQLDTIVTQWLGE